MMADPGAFFVPWCSDIAHFIMFACRRDSDMFYVQKVPKGCPILIVASDFVLPLLGLFRSDVGSALFCMLHVVSVKQIVVALSY